MIISVQDWVFDLNADATSQYCKHVISDSCECGYCRNFRQAINGTVPELNAFLTQIGGRVDAPEELMPYEPTIYEASYCISGKILQYGTSSILCGTTKIDVLTAEDTDYETKCEAPYFVLRTGCIELPWVLDEDMDEVVSPANEPEYLQRMWDRLLQYASDDTISS